MIHGRHRVYHTDRLASLAVSVVWMLRYTAAPHRGSILDLETGRTTAVLCKCHEATPSNHIARCPKRPKRSTQHAGIHTTGTGINTMTLSFSTLFTQYTVPARPSPPPGSSVAFCGSAPTL